MTQFTFVKCAIILVVRIQPKNKYYQEMSQSHATDQSTAPCERDKEQ